MSARIFASLWKVLTIFDLIDLDNCAIYIIFKIPPHIPDKGYVHPVTQFSYEDLLEAGVKIYEYTPGFIHSKFFVSDDRVATVGTINMDYRSFFFHFECGVWMCGNDAVMDIKNHFLELQRQSQKIERKKWQKRPLRQKLKQAILYFFAPFM